MLPSCNEGELRRNLVQKQDECDTREQVEAGHGSWPAAIVQSVTSAETTWGVTQSRIS